MILVVMRGRGVLQKLCEVLYGEVRLAYNGTKRTAIQLVMIWNYKLRKRFGPTEDHVAPVLAFENETDF